MDIQRLRNLTTVRLHTKMRDIYEDIDQLVGVDGVMSHQLPNAIRALMPFLREQVPDERFWDGAYDTTHTGEIEVRSMNDEEQKAFWQRFSGFPDPLTDLMGKVIVAKAGAQ
jgi:hypothetical protein